MKEYQAEPHMRRFHDLHCAGAVVRAIKARPGVAILVDDRFAIMGDASYRGIRVRHIATGTVYLTAYENEGVEWEVIE